MEYIQEADLYNMKCLKHDITPTLSIYPNLGVTYFLPLPWEARDVQLPVMTKQIFGYLQNLVSSNQISPIWISKHRPEIINEQLLVRILYCLCQSISWKELVKRDNPQMLK